MQLKATLTSFLFVIVCLVSATVAQENDGTLEGDEKRFDVVLTFDDARIADIRRKGFLKATLPPKYFNRVNSIVLRHEDSFFGKRLEIADNVQREGKTLRVTVDDSVVSHLGFQPVRMKIYESNFDSLLLSFNPKRKMIDQPASKVNLQTDSPKLFLRVNTGKGLYGHIKDVASIKIRTAFGEVGIPFQNLQGIRFNTAGPGTVVLIYANGDSVSGKISEEKIVLKTLWGDKAFLLKDLRCITKGRDWDVEESQDGDKRWWVQRVTANK